MIRGIDHLVIAVDDPDRAAVELEEQVGILVTGGGRHERFGTRNRIAWLADGPYVELIAIDDPTLVDVSPVGRAARSLLAGGTPGLAAVALVDDDLGHTVRALGPTSTMGDVHGGSRRRDDGELVSWRAAFPDADLAPDGPPFLIEHEPIGAEWGSEAISARAEIAHPIGSPVRLVGVEIATADPGRAADVWHRETGLSTRATPDLAIVEAGDHAVRFRPRREMAVGAVVMLAAPVPEARAIDAVGVRWAVTPAADSDRAAPVTAGRADPPGHG